MKVKALHKIKGLGTKVREAGETFEAKVEDVKHLLSAKFAGGEVKNDEHAAVLPVDKVPEEK